LEQNVNSAATQHLAHCGQQLQLVQNFLEEELDKRLDTLELVESGSGKVRLSVTHFLEMPAALQMEMARRLLVEQAGKSRDITSVHMEALVALAEGESGKRRNLPYGIVAGKDYDILWLETKTSTQSEEKWKDYRVCWERERKLPLEIKVPAMGEGWLEITLFRGKYPEKFQEYGRKIPKNICTKWFDYATIYGTLEFRHSEPGDFLWLDGEKTKRKTLSRLLIDCHVPREQRERLWVLAEGSSVIWIPELGRGSADYYVSTKTQEMLCADMNVLAQG
jgi:tRNA(Ile)-lysidine synthase